MREATGNALLTLMITSIVAVIMIFFVGSLSYSKSYRIKNYIVNEIEENKGWSPALQESIDSYMKDVGYHVRKDEYRCNKVKNIPETCIHVNTQSSYDYCVYDCSNGEYYKVVTFMKFEFPVVGNIIKFEVRGETRTFNYFSS